MITSQAIESKLYELRPFLAKTYNVEKLGYFGSYANNTNKENSDLDILVFFDKPLGWSFFDLKDLLEQELHLKIDLVSYDALRVELRNSIIQQTKFID